MKNENKNNLSSKTVAELKVIAKQKEIKGYSKMRKKGLVDAILNKKDFSRNISKSNESGNSYFDLFWKKYIDGRLRVIVSILAGLITISLFVYGQLEGLDIFKSNTFKNYSNNFRILILPLSPDRDCTVENVLYEESIKTFYNSIDSKFRIKVEPVISTNHSCPQSNNEAFEIGKIEKASVVIWGFYDEKCSGENRIKIRYTLIEDIGILGNSQGGDKELSSFDGASSLRNGYLLNNVNNIVYRTLAIYMLNNGDFKDVITAINNLNKSDCDPELLGIKAIAEYELGKNKNSVMTLSKSVNCLKLEKEENRERREKFAAMIKDGISSNDPEIVDLRHMISLASKREYAFYYYLLHDDYFKRIAPNTSEEMLKKFELKKKLNKSIYRIDEILEK